MVWTLFSSSWPTPRQYSPFWTRSIQNLAGEYWVIQSSTISARWTQLFAEQVRQTGALFLEAPFTGSKTAAEQRQTVYYLGGEPEVVEKVTPDP